MPTSYQGTTRTSASSQEATWWKRVFLGFLGGLGVILFIVIGIRLFHNPASISGEVDFTALKPSPGDEGEVRIMYRDHRSSGNFKETGVVTPLQDEATFTWEGAQEGSTYELTAQLVIRGNVTGTSDVITVTAPAQAIMLPVKVTWADLPQDVVAGSTTKLGGEVQVQGYVPDQAILKVETRGRNEDTFTVAEEITTVEHENAWTWSAAVPLQTYQVRALLITSDDKQVGSSDTVLAEAGETEVMLKVTSGAQPPATPAPTPTATPSPSGTPKPTATPAPTSTSIRGKVNINGPIQSGSTVLMLQRKPGQGEYQAFTRLTNVKQGGMDWIWKEARPGEQYEIQAALQVNEANTATGRSQIVTAPASNIDFTINTGVSIPTPSAQPTVEKCQDRSDGRWDATIKFPTVQDAQQYWAQIGANPGSSELFNQRLAPTNQQNVRATVTVDSGRTYFAQYAYSWCANCAADSNFSNFSTPWSFRCGDSPQPPINNFRGYRCNQDRKLCEATDDPNAPFAPNNSGLEQCQRACK